MQKLRAIQSSICIAVLLAVLFVGVGVWQIKPAQATVLLYEDFEDWNVNAWTNVTTGATLEVQSSVTYNYSGYALHAVGGTGGVSSYIAKGVSGGTENWLQFAVQPTKDGAVLDVGFRKSTYISCLMFTTTSAANITITYWDVTDDHSVTSATQLSRTEWTVIDLHYNISATDGCVQVFADGVELTDLRETSLNTTDFTPDKVWVGLCADYATSEVYVDDVRFSEEQFAYEPPDDFGNVTFDFTSVSPRVNGSVATFRANATATEGVLDFYICGTNVTGSWVNSTTTMFSGSWVNFSETLPEINDVVEWQVWGNNSYGIWGTTGLQSLTVLSVDYPFLYFHSGKGMLGIRADDYNRTNVMYARMQLSAEINNSAVVDTDILVPSGGYWSGDPLNFHFTENAWSEGGINFEYLVRNLAYCWDNDYVPDLALWITNLDPLDNRTYVCDEGNLTAGNLPLEIANATGYTNFLTYLKTWMGNNGYTNKYILLEPCWEFNLYPWTDWGGGGVGRYWALSPINYYNAMNLLMSAKVSVGFDNLIVASHIVPWSSEQWIDRGKIRILYEEDGYTFQDGMELCDVWGISLYGDYDQMVAEGGVHGYIDWLFDKIVKQCSVDSDIGSKFIGTFEYNSPEELYSLDTGTGYSEAELEQMDIDYINYSYAQVPTFYTYHNFQIFGWWMPVDTTSDMLAAFQYWSAYYDGYGEVPLVTVTIISPTNTTYTTSTVSVEISASGGTIDTILWNCTFTNGTVVYANTVYTVPTSMTLGDGSYVFNARANNTDGDWDEATVMFTVLIIFPDLGSWWGDWW